MKVGGIDTNDYDCDEDDTVISNDYNNVANGDKNDGDDNDPDSGSNDEGGNNADDDAKMVVEIIVVIKMILILKRMMVLKTSFFNSIVLTFPDFLM